jgi:hypothetical protein
MCSKYLCNLHLILNSSKHLPTTKKTRNVFVGLYINSTARHCSLDNSYFFLRFTRSAMVTGFFVAVLAGVGLVFLAIVVGVIVCGGGQGTLELVSRWLPCKCKALVGNDHRSLHGDHRRAIHGRRALGSFGVEAFGP